MIYYRLYQLCGPKNKVESFREFEADGDSIAIVLAETWRGLNPMELWSGHRKVRRWDSIKSRAQVGKLTLGALENRGEPYDVKEADYSAPL